MVAVVITPNLELPWSSSQEEDKRFWRVLGVLCVPLLILSIAIPFVPLPEPKREELEQLPPQLALAGAATRVHAIATVERILLAPPRILALEHSLLKWLRRQGVPVPRRLAIKLVVDSSQIGAGYAHPTSASRNALCP